MDEYFGELEKFLISEARDGSKNFFADSTFLQLYSWESRRRRGEANKNLKAFYKDPHGELRRIWWKIYTPISGPPDIRRYNMPNIIDLQLVFFGLGISSLIGGFLLEPICFSVPLCLSLSVLCLDTYYPKRNILITSFFPHDALSMYAYYTSLSAVQEELDVPTESFPLTRCLLYSIIVPSGYEMDRYMGAHRIPSASRLILGTCMPWSLGYYLQYLLSKCLKSRKTPLSAPEIISKIKSRERFW